MPKPHWQQRSFRRHQHLARVGETPECLFRIETGWACRYHSLRSGRRQISALFLPGETCEPQWALGEPCTGSIIALTDVRAAAIPIEIGETKAAQAALRQAMIPELLNLLARQARWIVLLGRKSALEQVSSLFLELLDRSAGASHTKGGPVIEMPLTQIEIGDITGLTPVHINRVMMQLRELGIIEIERRLLRIRDVERLRALSLGVALSRSLGSRSAA